MIIIGVILIPILCYLLFKPYKYMVAALMFSCLFQAASILQIGDKGIQPYLLISAFLVLRSILLNKNTIKKTFKKGFTLLVVLFAVYSIAITIIMPHIFEGVFVYDKSLDSSALGGGIKLRFGMSNITQIAYLILNCLTLCCLWINRRAVRRDDIYKYFTLLVKIFLIIGIWRFLSLCFPIYFPANIIYSLYNGESLLSTVDGIPRMSSTMSEPSFCGAVLAAIFWAIVMANFGKWKFSSILLLIVTGVSLLLCMAGTGLVTVMLGLLVFLYYKGLHKKIVLALSGFLVFAFALVYISGFYDSIQLMLATKSESQSGIVRMMAMQNSWDLFFKSYGMGVGMGSNRGSSFIIDMASSIGVIGLVLFGAIYLKLVNYAKKNDSTYISVFMLVMLIAQCLAIPDFSFCGFWLGIYMAASIAPVSKLNKRNGLKIVSNDCSKRSLPDTENDRSSTVLN